MSETKLCPYCGEEIKTGAIKCKHCHTELDVQSGVRVEKTVATKKPVYKRWWFWVAAVILLFAMIGSMGGGDSEQTSQPSANTSNSQAETVAEEPAPVALEVTVDKLVDDLKRNALSAASTYEDAYIELTGKLVTIDSSGDYFSLGILADDFSFDTVHCRIEDKHLDQVMAFETGQTVVLTGTIVSVGEVLGYTVKVETIK